MKEKVTVKGILEIYMRENGGEWKLIRKKENLITDVGLQQILNAILGTYGNYATFNYFAVGTGTTAPTAADTALETEAFRKAVSGVYEDEANFKNQYVCYITTTDYVGNISEFGIFDASSGGNMLNRITFLTFYKSDTQDLRFDYYLEIGRE